MPRSSKQPVLPPGGFAPLDAAEGAGFAASRWAAHCAAASQLQAETDAALDALNLSAFREIGLFLQSGTRRLQLAWAGSARDAPPGGPRRLPPYTELPAAVVHTATADRSLQLRQLLRHVVTNVSPHVAVGLARECGDDVDPTCVEAYASSKARRDQARLMETGMLSACEPAPPAPRRRPGMHARIERAAARSAGNALQCALLALLIRWNGLAPMVWRRGSAGSGDAGPGVLDAGCIRRYLAVTGPGAAIWLIEWWCFEALFVLAGVLPPDPERAVAAFGVLFNAYADISDTLVGLLIRARKRQLVSYEGDGMLFQGCHDHVLVRADAAP